MAVERVREGEKPSAVIAAYGFSRTTIYKWLKASSGRGKGLKALRAKRGSGRPRTLTGAQERQVFRWINGRDPRQYGLDFGLWTRAIVVTLIKQKFGVRLGVTAVGAMLANLGLTPQKPLQRAYQRDAQAIERWQQESYPAIAAQAKREGADIFFWDESGFRADTVHGKTWGIRGQTPVVQRPGQRQSVSAASAVNSRGAFWFCVYQGALNAELFIEPVVNSARAERKTLNAPRFDCDFFDAGNLARECKATGGTKATMDPVQPNPKRGTRTLTSQNMSAVFVKDTQDIDHVGLRCRHPIGARAMQADRGLDAILRHVGRGRDAASPVCFRCAG